MSNILSDIFGNDPDIPDEREAATHLYVAGIVAASLLFLIVVKAGMKSAAI